MNGLFRSFVVIVIMARDELIDDDDLRSLGHVVADEAVVERWVAPVVLSSRQLPGLLGFAGGVVGGGDRAASLLGGGGAAAGLGGAEVDVEEMHVDFRR